MESASRAALLERARKLATATLGDVLDAHNIPGVTSGLARRSGAGRIAGFAQTMLQQVGPLGSFRFEDFAVGPAFDATEKDSVLVVDMGGADVSTFGGLAALTLTVRGAAGALIDGGCRDLEDIEELGLTVVSRSTTPRTGKGRLRIVSRGEPVVCGGVIVHPGDIVVIDNTGALVIPMAKAEAVIAGAEELDRRDNQFAERLRGGAAFADLAASLRHA